MQSANSNPFSLRSEIQASTRVDSRLAPLITNVADRALALDQLADIYDSLPEAATAYEFAHHALATLQVEFDYNAEELSAIPASGPVAIVANHPYGGIDGLILIALLSKVRPDFKLLANRFLHRVPELSDSVIPVDVFGSAHAINRNARSIRTLLRHASGGGAFAMFPAGTVSHLHASVGQVCDGHWSAAAARALRIANAPIVPIHFSGCNSLTFQVAGLIHPLLRTALLSRELLNKQAQCVRVRIGKAIAPAQLRNVEQGDALAGYLRTTTYALGAAEPARKTQIPASRRPGASIMPLALPTSGRRVAEEIEALPDSRMLIRSNDMSVLYASAAEIPYALREIGRLREMSFRAVGEGTGKDIDLDRFDDHYRHLILWHGVHREIAGAYRIGHTDELVTRFDVSGLYTHTLFDYKPELLKRIGPALELGRSFVRSEYQKNFASLLLLWKGIAAYLARHRQYRTLFGPVSISADYSAPSRAFLLKYLREHCFDERLANLIRPRNTFRHSHTIATLHRDWRHLGDPDTISTVLSQIESDDKGMPILLRQYLKLGGKILGFNLDTAFGNVVDGLIMVDVAAMPQKTLDKYMGKADAAAYRAFHAQTSGHGQTSGHEQTAGHAQTSRHA